MQNQVSVICFEANLYMERLFQNKVLYFKAKISEPKIQGTNLRSVNVAKRKLCSLC